jgi:hypothetical protein
LSTDLVICNLDVFGAVAGRLVGGTVINGNELRSEISLILATIPEEEKVRAFDHWTARCEWVAEHDGVYFPV